MKRVVWILAMMLWAACSSSGRVSPSGDASQEAVGRAGYALYHGGEILTMRGDASEYAEAVVLEDDRIEYVGDLAGARERFGEALREIDLAGRTMLPGFIDTHVHYAQMAQVVLLENVKPWDFEDVDAFIDHVAEVASSTPEGEPIFVYGYDRALVAPHRNLTREDLDRATTRHPVYVLYLNLHWASANSLGLEAAGITRETPTKVPGGGIYFKDDRGEPTGLFTESAIFFIAQLVAQSLDAAAEQESLFAVAREMSAHGITLFADLATGAGGGAGEVERYAALAHNDAFPTRIAATPVHQLLDELDGPVAWDGRFQANRVKLLIDASLVGGTSATVAPQLGGGHGNLSYTREAYRDAVIAAMSRGFSVTTHTMGDRAHALVLDVFEEIDAGPLDLADFDHALEHSALIEEADLERMRALGLSTSLLSPLLYVYGDAMRDRVYGPEMAPRLFPASVLEAAGVNVALHSDAPIFATQPLVYAWVAVNRHTTSGTALGPEYAISPYTALRGITINAAKHLGLEREVGSIEPGKLADFAILDRNPLSVDPMEIRDVVVLETIKGGHTYYRAD